MDGINDQGYNGAGHEGQAQANALRRRINRQAAMGEQAGDTYMECRRNVSLSAGRYTVDGCSEFLVGAASDQNAMLCAVCGCHRSFHRKVIPNQFRVDPAHYLLFNDIPFVRPLPQPLQPPLPLMPQPEMPHEQSAESGSEEERSETDEESEERSETDEESEERSEIDSESEAEEEGEMINGGENNSKED